MASNELTNTLEASVIGSTVEAEGPVSVTATDTSSINAEPISVAASIAASGTASVAFAISATVADNAIGSVLEATIDSSVVDTNGAVTVEARADTEITALAGAISVSVAVGGTAAISGAGSGAYAANTTTNSVEASIIGSTVTAGGDVDVLATDISTISSTLFSVAVGVSGSGTVAVSLSVAITLAENSISGVADGDHRGFRRQHDVRRGHGRGVQLRFRLGRRHEHHGDRHRRGDLRRRRGRRVRPGRRYRRGCLQQHQHRHRSQHRRQHRRRPRAMLPSPRKTGPPSPPNCWRRQSPRAAPGRFRSTSPSAATFAENTIGGSLLATIDDSTVNTSGGAVIVEAFADKTIEAFGQAVGVSAGGAGGVSVNVGLSAVVATNIIANSVEASIKGGSDVDANHVINGSVTVSATGCVRASWRCWCRFRSPPAVPARFR